MKPTGPQRWCANRLYKACRAAPVQGQLDELDLAGFRKARGAPRRGGPARHYRFRRGLGCVHVVVYPEQGRFEAHWDRVDPRVSPAGHAVADVFPWLKEGRPF